MTEDKAPENDERGCALFIGTIVVAIAIGKLTQAAYGWLTLGVVLIVTGLIEGRRK